MADSDSGFVYDETFRSECRTQWSDIKASLGNVLSMLQASCESQALLSARVSALEENARHPSQSNQQSDQLQWVCPVCLVSFTHRESFKGHVRLMTLKKTARSHCRFDPHNPHHQVLLSHPRYGSGDFDSRALAFSHQMYDTVKSHSSSSRSSESSHSAVRERPLFSYYCFSYSNVATDTIMAR